MDKLEELKQAVHYEEVIEKLLKAAFESPELLEGLAALEHIQWNTWSLELEAKEQLSPERVERWKKYQVPYAKLSEEVKEFDREWARKVIDILKKHLGVSE